MSHEPEKPVFHPGAFEAGKNAAWVYAPLPELDMNEWFIAGPQPGLQRDEWIAAARTCRDQVHSGSNLILELVSGYAWAEYRATDTLATALDLRDGDAVFLSVRARVVAGSAATIRPGLRIADHATGLQGYIPLEAELKLPADGAWHDLEIDTILPVFSKGGRLARPAFSVYAENWDAGTRVQVAATTLGVADASRMEAVSQLLRNSFPSHVCGQLYDDAPWVDAAFTCHFLFVYDKQFYSPEEGYRIAAFAADAKRRFNGAEVVILWPAYPRIGIDGRNQFDFLRDMPGGLDGLRDAIHGLQAQGMRVLIPYLPWDTGTRREPVPDVEALTAMVSTLNADGVFLDTLAAADVELRRALYAVRPDLVLMPELLPAPDQLALCSASWAQYAHDPDPPGMPLLKWLEPRHRQYFTRRWESRHTDEMETAFFNGTGMLIWENIFGAFNPLHPEDAALWKRCSAVLKLFAPEFTSELWDPFYPATREEVFIHRWPGSPTTLFTLRNTGEAIAHAPILRWQLPPQQRGDNMQIYDVWNGQPAAWDMTEFGVVQVWGPLDRVGCIAVTWGRDPRLESLPPPETGVSPDVNPRPTTDTYAPRPVTPTPRIDPAALPKGMVLVPAGKTRMQLRHPRRECGCYPDPGTHDEAIRNFTWGSPHDGEIVHDYVVDLPAFCIDEAQVTNAQFEVFLRDSGYVPREPHNFLKHWPEGRMPVDIAELPVVWVDLNDARAYARWAGKRLPTEPEWQRAAQGDDGRAWPWGNEFDSKRCHPGKRGPMPARSLPEGRSPWGCYHMTGNVWEWTESERDDGHTRFCVIRGGSGFNLAGSGWYMQGGPQPCHTHTKFLLLWPGLDRCATIGFRCVQDIE